MSLSFWRKYKGDDGRWEPSYKWYNITGEGQEPVESATLCSPGSLARHKAGKAGLAYFHDHLKKILKIIIIKDTIARDYSFPIAGRLP